MRRTWSGMSRRGAVAAGLIVLFTWSMGLAQDLASFEGRTTVHRLKNGWTFVIVERDVAPVFSFTTQVDVGGAQETPGITGIAHMFEHMAFKGTPTIGTNNYAAERKALEQVEAAYQAYQKERLSLNPDPKKLEELLAAFRQKQQEAGKYVVTNAFGETVEREGGAGLNAGTGADLTVFTYSLPVNKFELFAYLESERFLHPVFREFYKERDVVQEERRMRTESQPIGRLVEQFLAMAFTAHPYHQPVVGYMSDLESFTRTDAEQFFRTYYVPSNIVTVIVGAVKADQAIPVLEKYFGRIAAGPKPSALRTVEPPQSAERTVVIKDPAQPFYLEGYHKPSIKGPDQAVYDAIDDVLSNGRTSRLYRSLVRDKKLAVMTQSFSSFPGAKYPNLWAVYAVPARNATDDQVRDAIRAELERLKTEPVSDEELARFKTRAKVELLRSLDDNMGLSSQLASYQTLFGDWRELFRYSDRVDKVAKEDIMRVAQNTFIESNRTVAMIVTEKAAEPAGAAKDDGGSR
jgi:predicted Zn-dependent peptidase